MSETVATLIVSASKDLVERDLNASIVPICQNAIDSRGVFTVALSGGSLVAFLATIRKAFAEANIDPRFEAWHVILADERCVALSDPDSNLGALSEKFFPETTIPSEQIYGINEQLLDGPTAAVAMHYEGIVKSVLAKSGGCLDLAVLGFGPDGHTCSLFPDHSLLKEKEKWVAPIDDSPKPPKRRITLTLPVLNHHTRHVIFCGAGSSKKSILEKIFLSIESSQDDGVHYKVIMREPPPYPCAMVRPTAIANSTVSWVVDHDAVDGLV